MNRVISGIHHITAIASDPRRNLQFYTGVLGLRLVKRTVNFDDPGTYHFYFGNAEGSPGSILTFFPWPHAVRGTIGNGQVAATTFAVPAASLDYWRARLDEHGAAARDADPRFGEPVLAFEDPDGLRLEIIGTPSADPSRAWHGGTVAAEHAICGFHSATLAEEGYEKTARLVADVMGFQAIGAEGNRFRYAAAAGPRAGAIVDVLCAPDGQRGRQGAGTVHHIAWRTASDQEQLAWRADLAAAGLNVTPVMDRMYFRSIYFREPGGVLFEIATDPPGFATDEAPEHLGERLMLPSWLEPHRGRIEFVLPPLE
jgi:catechol 2,3-dioxygenase-like lactoylglutathione lyase family enzyme